MHISKPPVFVIQSKYLILENQILDVALFLVVLNELVLSVFLLALPLTFYSVKLDVTQKSFNTEKRKKLVKSTKLRNSNYLFIKCVVSNSGLFRNRILLK